MKKVILKCMTCKYSKEDEYRSGIIRVREDMIDVVLEEYANLGIKSLGFSGNTHLMNTCIYCRRERFGFKQDAPRNDDFHEKQKVTDFPQDNGKGGGFW